VTNPRLFERALPIADAWEQVNSWLAAACAWFPFQPSDTLPCLDVCCRLRRIQISFRTRTSRRSLEHGLTVYSTDGDFARFPGLNWENPLAAPSESDN
jgi:uncharacterized protein